jgi:hypothetical protein
MASWSMMSSSSDSCISVSSPRLDVADDAADPPLAPTLSADPSVVY